MGSPSIFIIGAGVAGLACARVLTGAGFDVRLADKGRGPGGRCSTRRSPVGAFDHGAAYFTARDEGFVKTVARWEKAGVAGRWNARVAANGQEDPSSDPWYVGVPGMNAIVRHEAEDLGAEFGLEIGEPGEGRDGRFDISTKAGHQVADADLVVLAVPAPQAARLLPPDTPLKGRAETAELAPCWTLMAEFGNADEPAHDVWQPQNGVADAIFWQGGKPGRQPGSRFVLHASPDWSRTHLEDDPDDVSAELLAALRDAVPGLPSARHTAVHRWRYAKVAAPGEGDFGLDLEHGFATCGDWHIAPRIESAWLSGQRLGEALLREL